MTTDLRRSVVELLAAGEWFSRLALAERLNVHSVAIEQTLSALEAWDLPLEWSDDRVRCPRGLDLLDQVTIANGLADDTRIVVRRIDVLDELPSTNAYLLAESTPPSGSARVCLAEYQSAGRGRRGRRWLQSFGSGICLSVSWCFPAIPTALGALSLAAGVATVRALERFRVRGLSLKWPNDVMKGAHKLGGLLCELRIEPVGSAHVVIGVGLNTTLSPDVVQNVLERGGVLPADLADAGVVPCRNRLAAALIDELVMALRVFEVDGFAPFHDEWTRHDAYRDRAIVVQTPTVSRDGVARGIASDGSLRLETEGRIMLLNAGEVSIRAVS